MNLADLDDFVKDFALTEDGSDLLVLSKEVHKDD